MSEFWDYVDKNEPKRPAKKKLPTSGMGADIAAMEMAGIEDEMSDIESLRGGPLTDPQEALRLAIDNIERTIEAFKKDPQGVGLDMLVKFLFYNAYEAAAAGADPNEILMAFGLDIGQNVLSPTRMIGSGARALNKNGNRNLRKINEALSKNSSPNVDKFPSETRRNVLKGFGRSAADGALFTAIEHAMPGIGDRTIDDALRAAIMFGAFGGVGEGWSRSNQRTSTAHIRDAVEPKTFSADNKEAIRTALENRKYHGDKPIKDNFDIISEIFSEGSPFEFVSDKLKRNEQKLDNIGLKIAAAEHSPQMQSSTTIPLSTYQKNFNENVQRKKEVNSQLLAASEQKYAADSFIPEAADVLRGESPSYKKHENDYLDRARKIEKERFAAERLSTIPMQTKGGVGGILDASGNQIKFKPDEVNYWSLDQKGREARENQWRAEASQTYEPTHNDINLLRGFFSAHTNLIVPARAEYVRAGKDNKNNHLFYDFFKNDLNEKTANFPPSVNIGDLNSEYGRLMGREENLRVLQSNKKVAGPSAQYDRVEMALHPELNPFPIQIQGVPGNKATRGHFFANQTRNATNVGLDVDNDRLEGVSLEKYKKIRSLKKDKKRLSEMEAWARELNRRGTEELKFSGDQLNEFIRSGLEMKFGEGEVATIIGTSEQKRGEK
jgi:hypothetical protein